MIIKVSIITPTKDLDAHVIECAISARRSDLEESNITIEHIFVVDGGLDNESSWKTIKGLQNDNYQVRKISFSKNQGVAVARNEAIKTAAGNYLMFLDSDDAFEPQKIAKQVKLMEQQNANFSYTGFVEFSDRSGREWKVGASKVITVDVLRKRCPICTSSVCISRDWLVSVMDVSENLFPCQKMRSDWLGWFKLAGRDGFHSTFVDGHYVRRRVSANSLTANKLKTIGYNYLVYRHTGHSIIVAICKAFIYPFDSLRRRIFHKARG